MKKGILFVLGTLLVWGGLTNVAFAGFGITPPYVRNETLRQGSEYTQEIIIVRSDPVEDLNAELTYSLPGYESWFSSDRGTKFILPKGESQVKLHITVRVPDDAKLGAYNGNIRIRTYSSENASSGVSLALGAQIDVHLKVVDEVFDFQVRRVELAEAEEGYKKWWLSFPGKVKFAIYLENTGNVPAAPYKVVLSVYDVTGTQLLETTENTNRIDTILPFDTKKIYAYIPTWLPPGSYSVKYDIKKTETESAQTGQLSLSVLPRGTITGYEQYGFEGLKLADQLSLIIPVAILLLSVVTVIIVKKSKRKKRSRRTDSEDEPPRRQSREVSPPPRRAVSSGVVDLSRKR
jgi:hypothetical protein